MLLLLARHGNTFNAGDKVVWVGGRTDLPLTARGKEQAEALGEALRSIKPAIKRVVAGPLKRTRNHADIAARSIGFTRPVEIDERLREIDYGLWEAKTTGEIRALGGAQELQAWDSSGTWPASPGWSPPEQTITANITQLARDLETSLSDDDAALLVTSNGILKFFLKLVPGAFGDRAASGSLKVSTGNCCALRCEAGTWELAFWNCEPGRLAFD